MRSRMGDSEAEQLLFERFFSIRFIQGRRSRPDLFPYLSPLDFNSLFFKVFMNAQSTFRFGIITFRGYLQTILGHEIGRQVVENFRPHYRAIRVVRLDTLIDENQSEEATFHDIIADETPANDPRVFLDYAESLAKLSKLPPKIDQTTVDLMRLRFEGYSVEEAAAVMGIDYYNARTMIRRFQRFASFVLGHGGKKKVKFPG